MQTYLSTNVLIVDDHYVTRTGLKYLLRKHFNIERIAEAESCSSTLNALSAYKFSHAILDLQLGDGNMFDLFSGIRKGYPDTQFIIHTDLTEEVYGKKLIQMGAMGFIHKSASENEFLYAIKLFLNGKMYISSQLLSIISGSMKKTSTHNINPFLDLSKRELEVIHYILQGCRIKEIADKLQIGITTVATYKSRIFEKFSVNNAMDLKNIANQFHFEAN